MRSDRSEYHRKYWIKNKEKISAQRKTKYVNKKDPELMKFSFNEVKRIARKLNVGHLDARKFLAGRPMGDGSSAT